MLYDDPCAAALIMQMALSIVLTIYWLLILDRGDRVVVWKGVLAS